LRVGKLISHVDLNMSMKLLPVSVDPVDPSQASDGSASLVLLTHRAITAPAGQISLVPFDAFARPSSPRRGQANVIYGTPVEDPDLDETTNSYAEYVSVWAGSYSVERTAIAHYLFYAAGPTGWIWRLINVYA
jgi:hypothetical protein